MKSGIGSVNFPVGEVGAVGARPETNSVVVHHKQSSVQIRTRTRSRPRRVDSSELADPLREAVKLVRELNRAVASHQAVAVYLGGNSDGPNLRDELRRTRRTAQEAAAAAKNTILPPLMEAKNSTTRWTEKERHEFERLWYLLLSCLDGLANHMARSLLLLREFSLAADGNNILINTGNFISKKEDSGHDGYRQSQSSSDHDHEVALLDKLAIEGVEASQLCKELFELRAQLQELKSVVEIQSTFAQPDVEPEEEELSSNNTRRNETVLSINGNDLANDSCSIINSDEKESIESDDESQENGITPAQRKCICYILGAMVTLFLLAMLLGLFFALFS